VEVEAEVEVEVEVEVALDQQLRHIDQAGRSIQ